VSKDAGGYLFYFMKKKAAILLDGEWFRKGLDTALKGKLPYGVTADVMYRNAMLALGKDEELFRLFYYDCPPYSGKETNPINRVIEDFEKQPKHQARTRFIKELKAMDCVAMRLGIAKKRGWTLKDIYIQKAMSGSVVAPAASDVFFEFGTKGR
jgi:hypothetical protein